VPKVNQNNGNTHFNTVGVLLSNNENENEYVIDMQSPSNEPAVPNQLLLEKEIKSRANN
jgi:hypothetical protein